MPSSPQPSSPSRFGLGPVGSGIPPPGLPPVPPPVDPPPVDPPPPSDVDSDCGRDSTEGSATIPRYRLNRSMRKFCDLPEI